MLRTTLLAASSSKRPSVYQPLPKGDVVKFNEPGLPCAAVWAWLTVTAVLPPVWFTVYVAPVEWEEYTYQ